MDTCNLVFRRRCAICVIVVCKERALTEKEVREAFRANPDGGGLAWYEDGKVVLRKGFMKVNHMLDCYLGEHVNEKLPHVVHCRRATSKVTQKLTHPFIVSEKSPLKLTYHGNEAVLFHNGVVSDWKKKMFEFYLHNAKKIPDGDFSDSRFVAILVHFLGENILPILGDKYVMFSISNINMYGSFSEDSGVFATNSSYKTGNVVYTSSQLKQGWGRNGSNPMNVLDPELEGDSLTDIFGD